MNTTQGLIQTVCAGLLAAALSACGGGGSTATVAPAVTVSGTAATGAAIAAGTVTLKCVSGTSTSAVTGIDGSFSIDIGAVTLPCVARVDYKDGTGAAQKLHTYISAAGTANITPVTELLVASLTAGSAADAFDKFDAVKAKAITAAQVKSAVDAVKAYLKNTLGVDTTNLPDDPVGTKLVARTGGTDGDKADKVLDDLKAKLATAGKKLSDAVSDLTGVGGTPVAGGAGCTDKVAALFTKSKGSYTTKVSIFLDPADKSGAAAGFTDGASATVVVNTDCSIDIGPIHHFVVKDNSYFESVDASGTQYDVDMTSAGLTNGHFEVFTNGKRGMSFSDPAKVSTVRFDE